MKNKKYTNEEIVKIVIEANDPNKKYGEKRVLNDLLIHLRVNVLDKEKAQVLEELEDLAYYYYSYGVLHAPKELETLYFKQENKFLNM